MLGYTCSTACALHAIMIDNTNAQANLVSRNQTWHSTLACCLVGSVVRSHCCCSVQDLMTVHSSYSLWGCSGLVGTKIVWPLIWFSRFPPAKKRNATQMAWFLQREPILENKVVTKWNIVKSWKMVTTKKHAKSIVVFVFQLSALAPPLHL